MPIRSLPLVDASHHRDACGVGFVADRAGHASHRMVRLAVQCLHNLDHRGAKSADGTGDGAGLMTRIPYRLLHRELGHRGVTPPPDERLGVLMVFHSEGDTDIEGLTQCLADQDVSILARRRVPTLPSILGDHARATLPRVEQVIVAAGDSIDDESEFERRLLLVRKATFRTAPDELGVSVVSSSCRTVVYKGLFTANNIERFYPDLLDPLYETDFAVFHQRYSTNTLPDWSMAQPFRMLAHNGEINTIRSNRAWMAAREIDAGSDVWGDRSRDLRPFLAPGKSDSGSLDNAFELLVDSGRSLAHAKEMLMPPAWENVSDLDNQLRAFYEYHAFLTEPWDGPAAIAASDGVTVLAGMDRNGLRPARWMISPETVLVASEVGVLPEEEVQATATGQLGPGEVLSVDLGTGRVRFSDDVKRDLAGRRPYGDWINTATLYVRDPFDDEQDDRFDAAALSRVFGYTAEERRLLLTEMASGRAAIGSMGNDTPLAALSSLPERLSRYFHQMFAQVTNPPIDPIRERLMMSLRTYLGRRGSLLTETPEQAHLIELASPILSDAEVEHIAGSSDPSFQTGWIEAVFPAAEGAAAMRRSLAGVCDEAVAAVHDGASILILSDRTVDAEHAPIPMLLAVGAVHHRLIAEGIRMRASLVAVSGEPRDEHDIACLIAYGASAVNPYLAIEHVRDLAAGDEVPATAIEAQENYRGQLEEGLLKIMSKMGIGTVSAYRGSELFEVVGLDSEIADIAFRYTPRRVGGHGLERIAADVLVRHGSYAGSGTELGGYYKHRRGGPAHVLSPGAVLALQKSVRSGEAAAWERYIDLVMSNRPPAQLRDLMEPVGGDPIPVDEVEPAEHIMRRFHTAAMSAGALSAEAHEALAEAMSFIGGMSNSGEGGEDPQRYATPRNSRVKQIASGRFGVTPAYLASAEEFQIKMAQGSKPGEGGHLPGYKVTAMIARLRHTEPGVPLISPPPHHDIYSIEDLAQLVYDLKTFKPSARVSVKLVSEPGVGVIAVGVAKSQADGVLISGNEGGTGASPLTSVKHAGSPWEIGLTETHQTLAAHGMRDRVVLAVDGGLRTGRDVVVAALLGAERYGFGTLPLLALGCKMVRRCHENTCPVGVATQRADLRAKFTGAAEQVVTLFRLLAEDVRRHLAELGVRSIDEIIGRTDLLRPVDSAHPVARSLDDLLVPFEARYAHRRFRRHPPSPLGEALIADAEPALARGSVVEVAYPASNSDRALGTQLSGLVAMHHGDTLAEGTIRVRLSGAVGQSLGAFLSPGIDLHLDGFANDAVGKGMGGGAIAIVPKHASGDAVPHGAGNAVLYGATGGSVFIAGTVGQRFAVRNSGAVAVVEGCSDHGCEYMTGGRVVVLGPVGRNLAAGMTGGVLFVWDPNGAVRARLADAAPQASEPTAADLVEVGELIEEHERRTGSIRARSLLESWDTVPPPFLVVRAAATVGS